MRDVVDVLPRLLSDPACAGGVYNVGSDQPIEIGALAELVRDTLQSAAPMSASAVLNHLEPSRWRQFRDNDFFIFGGLTRIGHFQHQALHDVANGVERRNGIG